MQKPKKIFLVKKSCQNFLGCTLSGMSDTGRYTRAKRKEIPSGIPSQVIMKKVKNVVTLLLGRAHHFTRRLKLLECAHNLEQPFPSLLNAWGRVLGFRVQLYLELVHLPAYLPEQVFLMVCHFASFLVYSIISLQPPTPLNCFLILVLSNAEYNFQSLQLSLCTKNVLTVG